MLFAIESSARLNQPSQIRAIAGLLSVSQLAPPIGPIGEKTSLRECSYVEALEERWRLAEEVIVQSHYFVALCAFCPSSPASLRVPIRI
jgi:hypothetical protein